MVAATALATAGVMVLVIGAMSGAFTAPVDVQVANPASHAPDRTPQKGADPGGSAIQTDEVGVEVESGSDAEAVDEKEQIALFEAEVSGGSAQRAPSTRPQDRAPAAAPAQEPSPTAAPPAPAEPGVPEAQESQAALDATNAQRAAVGAGALARNSTLVARACAWASQMAAADSMRHSTGYGAGFAVAAENVAAGYATAAAVVAGWMASDGHRSNILEPAYTQGGVCFADSASGVRYWAQQFGA